MGQVDTSEVAQVSADVITTVQNMDVAPDTDALWGILKDYAKSVKADLISYHHHASTFAPDKDNFLLLADGFPQGWIDKYKREELFRFDPIASLVNFRVRPIRWMSVENSYHLTPEQHGFMAELRKWLKGDGMGIPVFGPSGRSGYIGIGSTVSIDHWDTQFQRRIQHVCGVFHLRFCELRLMALENDFVLTRKERVILQNVALGRSDALICGLIGVQIDGVESAINRMLKKMGVSDRPSAILRGIGCGLIKPNEAEIESGL